MRWAWVIAVAVLGGCYGDPDRFNRKQADILCELERDCSGFDFHLDGPQGISCEDNREEELAECTVACEYDEDAATDCIRALKKAARPSLFGPDCGLDEGAIDACREVYFDCQPLPDEHLMCDVPEPEANGCAVVPDASGWQALVGLGLAAALRRRRVRR